MADLPNQLVELFLQHICHYCCHNLTESVLKVRPHCLLAIVVAAVRRLEEQYKSMAHNSFIFIHEVFDRFSFVSCMIIQHDIGQLR